MQHTQRPMHCTATHTETHALHCNTHRDPCIALQHTQRPMHCAATHTQRPTCIALQHTQRPMHCTATHTQRPMHALHYSTHRDPCMHCITAHTGTHALHCNTHRDPCIALQHIDRGSPLPQGSYTCYTYTFWEGISAIAIMHSLCIYTVQPLKVWC